MPTKGPKIENFEDLPLELKFQARMNFSSEPPNRAYFVGNSEDQDSRLNFQARLKFSSGTENFKRDCISGP